MMSSEERKLMFQVADAVNFEIDNPQKLSDYVKPLFDYIKSEIVDFGRLDEQQPFVVEWYIKLKRDFSITTFRLRPVANVTK